MPKKKLIFLYFILTGLLLAAVIVLAIIVIQQRSYYEKKYNSPYTMTQAAFLRDEIRDKAGKKISEISWYKNYDPIPKQAIDVYAAPNGYYVSLPGIFLGKINNLNSVGVLLFENVDKKIVYKGYEEIPEKDLELLLWSDEVEILDESPVYECEEDFLNIYQNMLQSELWAWREENYPSTEAEFYILGKYEWDKTCLYDDDYGELANARAVYEIYLICNQVEIHEGYLFLDESHKWRYRILKHISTSSNTAISTLYEKMCRMSTSVFRRSI